jgi:anthranilate 1,2-dioxygenase large subunit/terephthalate 1,2-dioxygenase oxygenase component alpha subunit
VLHKPVVVTGRFTQMLPNNWKLYFENVKDTYHASLLHTFFTTFRINRLSQRGGMVVSPDGGSHASFSFIDKQNKENDYAAMGIRSDNEAFTLKDPSLLDNADEFGDGCHMQILSVYPNMVLQQIQNALAIRQVLPKGQMQTALNWTTFGFADDTPEMKTRRLRQNNLAGPAGYVSMEDGAVGGFVQRGVAAAGGERAVVEMGGSGTVSEGTRATEASVRGFWKAYRGHMGI